ncbi:MAG: Rmf/CrpP family protein [Thermoguttaceae bacterium]
MSTREAYQEGYDAYWEGVDQTDNPYDEDTAERLAWEDGWRAGRRDDYDESDG